MEERDQNITSILKHIKGLRKDIREMRKSMDSASKMVFTKCWESGVETQKVITFCRI